MVLERDVAVRIITFMTRISFASRGAIFIGDKQAMVI